MGLRSVYVGLTDETAARTIQQAVSKPQSDLGSVEMVGFRPENFAAEKPCSSALNAVVEPGCCRTPPPGSRRAASASISAAPLALGSHAPRDKEHHSASAKCQSESTAETLAVSDSDKLRGRATRLFAMVLNAREQGPPGTRASTLRRR